MSVIRNSLRNLLAACHRLAGVVWFHAGAHDRARRHFQRILELRGDDFSAYVHLGRLAYSLGDYAGWRRECEHARRTNPERFARLEHPFELHQAPAAGTVFEEAGERASWRLYRVGKPGSLPVLRGVGGLAPSRPAGRRGDDFASAEERARFRDRTPVTRDEIHGVDVEDLARRLSS